MNDAERSELERLRARVAELEAKDRLRSEGLEGGPMAEPSTLPTRPDILFSAIEKTRMPMIVTDPHQPDNPIIFVNRAFLKLSGYAADELLGRNCRFLQGEETSPDDVARVRDAIAARRDIAIDILNYRKDGSPFVNELYISPVFDRSGELLYFFGSQVDLTQYADDRRELQKSEQRYRSLFEAIDDGFCVFEMIYDDAGKPIDYRFLEVNSAFEAQTGLKDAVGKRIREMAPEHEQRWFDLYGSVATEQRSLRFEDYAAALGRYYEILAYPIDSPKDRRVAALFSDVTERKRAELDLKALTETLEEQVAERSRELVSAHEALNQSQKMEAIGQLTGGVAHDFNNLLTVIKGSVDLLKRPDVSEERRQRYTDAIADTADRAARLTGQLLAFARRQSLKPETFDAGESVTAMQRMIGTLTGSRIRIVLDIPAGQHLIDTDRGQFDTAIVNMAVNARDAMESEGTLTIGIGTADGIPPLRSHEAVAGNFITVTVRDTGAGIAADLLDRIFEPFYTTKDVGSGTGLGLSQVFGFVKQSGGDILVTSEAGQGAAFVLYLPQAVGSAEVPVIATRPIGDDRGAGACILIVEDNAEVGRFAAEALSELGYTTLLASDGASALAELATDASRFQAVFSDVVMPGMSGIELGNEIKRLDPSLPVILTSGYSNVLAADGTHGFDLLRKPYSIDDLARILRAALDSRQTSTTG